MWPFHSYHLFFHGNRLEDDDEGDEYKFSSESKSPEVAEDEPQPLPQKDQYLEEIEEAERAAEEEVLQAHPTAPSGLSAEEYLLRRSSYSDVTSLTPAA